MHTLNVQPQNLCCPYMALISCLLYAVTCASGCLYGRRSLWTQLLVSARMRTVTEALSAIATRVILLFQMNRFQMTAKSSFGSKDGTAQATHPLAAVDRCKAILDSLQNHNKTGFREKYRIGADMHHEKLLN